MEITIPQEIILKIQQKYPEKDIFEYIISLIKENLSKEVTPAYSLEDENKVKERLKSLGYLD